jgi:hypothetical protein
MKILGVTFDAQLSWKPHVEKVIRVAKITIHGLRILRRNLPLSHFMRVLTSQFFSKVYYGSPIWLNSLLENDLKRVERIHYRALRVGIYDFKNKVSRDLLDHDFKRATPREWSNYSVAQEMIRIFVSKCPSSLFTRLEPQGYLINRPTRMRFYDASRTRIGHQCFENKVSRISTKLTFDWFSRNLSKDKNKNSFKASAFQIPLFCLFLLSHRLEILQNKPGMYR